MLLSRLTLTICKHRHRPTLRQALTSTCRGFGERLDWHFCQHFRDFGLQLLLSFFLRMIYNLQVLKRFFNARRTAFVTNTLNSTCSDLIAFEWWYFGAASSSPSPSPSPSRTSCPSTWDYLGNGPRSTYQKSKLVSFCVRVYLSKGPWGIQYFYAAKVPIPYRV